MYKWFSSLDVDTSMSSWRVARFSAERMFSLVSGNSSSCTFKAVPGLRRSISLNSVEMIFLCLPSRPFGTSPCRIDWKFIDGVCESSAINAPSRKTWAQTCQGRSAGCVRVCIVVVRLNSRKLNDQLEAYYPYGHDCKGKIIFSQPFCC